jgi:serpin B
MSSGSLRRSGLAGILCVAVILLSAGCPWIEGDQLEPAPGQLVKSEKARITSPELPAGDLAELVAANTAFAFDLYQQVSDQDGNLFCSPYSVSIALAMTYAGARGETEQQMADALNFTLPQDRLHPAFNVLDQALASRGASSDEFELHVVNRIWGQVDYSFLESFLDVLAENYGAGLNLLDFVNATEQSRVAINDWVADQTRDRIKDLIAPGAITALTRLVLTNAVYFKAAWEDPFDEGLTQDGSFHRLDESEVTVPMMRQNASFGYAAGDGYQAVELRYEGGELSMVIFLPDAARFAEFEATLDAARVDAIAQALAPRDLALTMPRFSFTRDLSLTEILSAMGMPIAFTGAADLSGMNGNQDLFIQGVLHKAFVAVDEEGTEAAAATAVIIGLTAVPPSELNVTIDRPFVFIIRDIETKAILFVGRVLDPST